MTTNLSTDNICCQSVLSDINNINNNNISLKDIIFGWDKFNTRVFILFIASFIIWSVVFFLLYDPRILMEEGHGSDGGHDHAHAHVHEHGMEHEIKFMKGNYFFILGFRK